MIIFIPTDGGQGTRIRWRPPRPVLVFAFIFLFTLIPALLYAQESKEEKPQQEKVRQEKKVAMLARPSYANPSKLPTRGTKEIDELYPLTKYKGRLLERGIYESTRGKFFEVSWPPVVKNRLEKAVRENKDITATIRGSLRYYLPNYEVPFGAAYSMHEADIVDYEETPMVLFEPDSNIKSPENVEMITLKGVTLSDFEPAGSTAYILVEEKLIRVDRAWSVQMLELMRRAQSGYSQNTIAEVEGYFLPKPHRKTGLQQFVITAIKHVDMGKLDDSHLIKFHTSTGLPVITDYFQAQSCIGVKAVFEGTLQIAPAQGPVFALDHFREARTVPLEVNVDEINDGISGYYKVRLQGTVGAGPSILDPIIETVKPINRPKKTVL